jgi:hypothetical protein
MIDYLAELKPDVVVPESVSKKINGILKPVGV